MAYDIQLRKNKVTSSSCLETHRNTTLTFSHCYHSLSETDQPTYTSTSCGDISGRNLFQWMRGSIWNILKQLADTLLLLTKSRYAIALHLSTSTLSTTRLRLTKLHDYRISKTRCLNQESAPTHISDTQ